MPKLNEDELFLIIWKSRIVGKETFKHINLTIFRIEISIYSYFNHNYYESQ